MTCGQHGGVTNGQNGNVTTGETMGSEKKKGGGGHGVAGSRLGSRDFAWVVVSHMKEESLKVG